MSSTIDVLGIRLFFYAEWDTQDAKTEKEKEHLRCTAMHVSLRAKASGCCSLNSATTVIQFGIISGRIEIINL